MKNKNNINAKYSKFGYIFCIPFVVVFLIFSLYPIFYTAAVGFTDLKGLGNTTMHFLKDDPFANFKNVLSNGTFRVSFTNTIKIWVCNFIPQILIALLITSWFTDKRSKIQGEGFFKVIVCVTNFAYSFVYCIYEGVYRTFNLRDFVVMEDFKTLCKVLITCVKVINILLD